MPVVLRPMLLDALDPPFAELEVLPTNGRPVTNWRNKDAALLDIAEGVKRVVESMTGRAGDSFALESGESLPEKPAIPIWHVPVRRGVCFTGRDALLETLHTSLLSPGEGWPAIQALTGLGGAGKTSLVVRALCPCFSRLKK